MKVLKFIKKNFRFTGILILAGTTVGVYILTLITVYINVRIHQNIYSGFIALTTNIRTITAVFTGFIAVGTLILALAGIAYVTYKPKVFAYLRQEKSTMLPSTMTLNDRKWISYTGTIEKRPMLGIYIENAGRSVAWNGKVKVHSPCGKLLYEDGFTRLRPMEVYEYPTDKNLPIDESVKERREIEVKINYEDENEKEYPYKIKIGIPKEVDLEK